MRDPRSDRIGDWADVVVDVDGVRMDGIVDAEVDGGSRFCCDMSATRVFFGWMSSIDGASLQGRRLIVLVTSGSWP